MAEVDRVSGSGNGIIQPDGLYPEHINLGKVPEDLVGQIVIAEMNGGRHAQIKRKVESTSIANEFRNVSSVLIDGGVPLSTSEDTSQVEDDAEMVGDTGKTRSLQNKGEDAVTSNEGVENIDRLREEAESNSTENVSDETVSTTIQTQQYNRSSEVKEYVKKRADGFCEGCEEPAPFTSKTGKPYLHAHHIHELSNGGSDTPETVIALCPNCHYRVHHGKDGEEYNQELLKNIQEIESVEDK